MRLLRLLSFVAALLAPSLAAAQTNCGLLIQGQICGNFASTPGPGVASGPAISWPGLQTFIAGFATGASSSVGGSSPQILVQDSGTSYATFRAANSTQNGAYFGSNGTVGTIGFGAASDAFLINNNTSPSGRLVLGSAGAVHEVDYPSGCFFIGTVGAQFDCGASTLAVAAIDGGNLAGSSVIIRSTTSGSPSGDSITLQATTVSARASSGVSTFTVGVSGVTSGQINIAGSVNGVQGLAVSGTASSGIANLPVGSYNILGDTLTQTETNKTISGSSNTLTNIANGSLTNSSMTISGAVVSLGGTYAPARNQTLPSNPTGTTSTAAFVMMGLSSGVTRFTPTTSGNIWFHIAGSAQNTVANDGCQLEIRYGTGNGPANAAAVTGTLAGTSQQFNVAQASGNLPFSVTGYATGLTLSTAYYYDLAVAALAGGTCTPLGITMTAMEM